MNRLSPKASLTVTISIQSRSPAGGVQVGALSSGTVSCTLPSVLLESPRSWITAARVSSGEAGRCWASTMMVRLLVGVREALAPLTVKESRRTVGAASSSSTRACRVLWRAGQLSAEVHLHTAWARHRAEHHETEAA
jgi:hypothetical protein